MGFRVGIGVDAHRCVSGRPLVLGGIVVPADFGLEAHSDGDVVCHAIIDALFGAANLGDKGQHFPSTDPAYKDIRSTVLLERTIETLRTHGCQVIHVDVSVLCERPRISDYSKPMQAALAQALGIEENRVSVKGTTTEGLGFAGRGEGIAAFAVAMIDRDELYANR